MFSTLRYTVLTALVGLSFTTHAALPQPGLWAIDSEINGRPGRGIYLDRQSGTLVTASYFGYRKDGSATFYLSTGILNDSIFSGQLIEYKNGPSLGGAIVNGEVAKDLGQIKMEFSSENTGFITLPGESKKSFSLYKFDDHRERLSNNYKVTTEAQLLGTYTGRTISDMSIEIIKSDIFTVFTLPNGVECVYSGPLYSTGKTFAADVNGSCSFGLLLGKFRLHDLMVNENGVLSMELTYLDTQYPISPVAITGKVFGVCVDPQNQQKSCKF